jgi:cyclic pyranopterin monophosphate synthase
MSEIQLTHLDETGQAKMVDVGSKADTERMAVAGGEVLLKQETVELIRQGLLKKGDVLTVAKIAGIMGAKKTPELIPLCHPISLTQVEVDLRINDELPGVMITATTRTVGKTGVEMEALTAVTIAALTVYDMVKAVDRKAKIQNVRLIEKHGGRSGDVYRESE